MPRITADDLLAAARRELDRVDASTAAQAVLTGARMIDIRSESQLSRDGLIPGALTVPRNTLEWRLDPASEHRHPDAPDLDDRVIVVCDEGYQSSLVAATLKRLGFVRATDLEGGFRAWRAAGLPIVESA